MMIMLLIPRLLVAVAVMLIITDVGVIAMRFSFSGWLWKPKPNFKSRSPDFQTTHEENIYRPYKPPIPYFQTTHEENILYRPYKPPIPYFKSHWPYFETTHEENIYRPYEHNLSSGIDSYGRKSSNYTEDDLDSLERYLSNHFEPNDKNNDDSKIQKLMKPLETDHQVSTPSAPVNRKDSLSSFLSIGRKPNDKNNDDSILSSKNSSFVPKPNVSYNDKLEDVFHYFLKKSMMPKEARGRLILSAPVNQTVNATSAQPQNPEVTTISTAITADTQLVDELQDPSTNLGKGLGLLILSDPVNLEEPSTWDFTKTSRGPQVKGFQRIDRLLTPGATVEHNLEEKKLPTNKNLVQPQLPLKTKEEILKSK